jgi:ribosomal protein S18 acetylase RimI-like enzyme
MRIRPYRADDLAGVAAMDNSFDIDSVAVLEMRSGAVTWLPAPVGPRTKSRELIGELTDPESRWTVGSVAEIGARTVGFCAAGFEPWNRRATLWHLYVDRPARRRGVGRALLSQVVDFAKECGARQLWLETQDSNVPAIRAYERLGFDVVGFDLSLYENPPGGEVAVFMSLPVERFDRLDSSGSGAARDVPE